ncbi:MAG: phosphoribosylaminoimidazolesuccinocarboxamide synthase [Acidobacteriota bacterium]|jgi:phosphoribosylaminoimidazole-succinocarboxamide synthase
MSVVLETRIEGATFLRRGKVRDIYRAGDDLLIVATDRLSAFDHVLPDGIPDKGAVLTRLSRYWFERTSDLVRNHLISMEPGDYPEPFRSHGALLRDRSMLVRSLEMFPVECVARGYLVGSGWKEYQKTGGVSGVKLPEGLRLCDRLPEPIFTPATKVDDGHDENISFGTMCEILGEDLASRLRALTMEIYTTAFRLAEKAGILLADTKFEFGRDADGEIVLADEVLTPDSSRFWPAAEYAPGRNQPSFDKQYVRDYLEKIGWDKNPPVPSLPAEIVQGTADRYREIYTRLTGRPFDG